MIKAVIFDYFGVISAPSLGRFVSNNFSDNELTRVQQLRRQADLGHITRVELINKLADLAGVPVEAVLADERSAEINHDLVEYIRNKLKGTYKIGILSNASGDYPKEKMTKQDLELFDDIVVSYHFGLVKPDPQIYSLAAKRLNVKPDECVFVDDNEVCTNGAKATGMQAIWYRSFTQMQTDLEKILAAGADN
jgi:epoxide hydrolase-like predicted phosphatase